MASSPPPPSFTMSVFVLLLLTTTADISTASALSTTRSYQELESMLQTLRRDGYTLFTNAITTSDLKFQLLTTFTNATTAEATGSEEQASPFTLFAPTDELLFSLDMASDAEDYVSTLKYHVIPNRRHTFDGLRYLTSPFLETLLPHYSVLIGKTSGGHADLFDNATANAVGIMVDGVRLTKPDLFIGTRIVVHGIDGILLTGLNLNHQIDHNESASGLAAPAGSPLEMFGPGRNMPAQRNPHSKPRSQRKGISSAVAPAARSDGKISMAPPGVLQDKAKKSLTRGKKTGRRSRSGGGSQGRRPKGHRHHRLEDL